MAGLGVLGIGFHLPTSEVDNTTIAEQCGADPDWIEGRTGVISRRRAPLDQTTCDLATAAAADAIVAAGYRPDFLILAASVPDRPMPPTAPSVQRRLGLNGTAAFDVNAACAGFVHALAMGWGATRIGLSEIPLVIGVDVLSRYVDPSDRRTAPLFGDGAGALVLGPVPEGYGLLAARLWADGAFSELIRIPLRPDRRQGDAIPAASYFEMDGHAAADAVVRVVPEALCQCLHDAGLADHQVDRLIVHQANVRLVETLRRSLGLSDGQMPATGRTTGNTGAASIPVGLALSNQERPLRRDEIVALLTMGAGASVGVAVIRWH